MASTFTLNFLLSGILGYGWGSFNQPGLLNFGVFSVCNFNLNVIFYSYISFFFQVDNYITCSKKIHNLHSIVVVITVFT